MKVLLVSANREHAPYPVFPIGLACLAGPLAAAGHELSVIDLCFEDTPEAAVRKAMAEFAPDAVAVSVRNIDNVTFPSTRSYLSGVRDIVSICAETARVIIGGSGFSLMPAAMLDFLGGDYGVAGEGETVLPLLLDHIAAGRSPEHIPGVVCRGRDGFIPPDPVAVMKAPLRELFNVAAYHRHGGMANLQTKRGCPFACIYCTYPLLEGRTVRTRPVPEIIAEIRGLIDGAGVSYIYFVDDIFNYPPEFAEELCRAMADAGLPVRWSAFINPDFLTPSLLDLMLAAGCDALEFGTDSGSPAMLASLGKSFDAARVRYASSLCRERSVDFAHYILFGGPGETAATVAESFCLMDEIAPTAVIAMLGIRIYPGTEIHRIALAEGVVSPETNLLEPVFYLSPAVGDTLCDLVRKETRQRPNWIVPGLDIPCSDAMLEALRHFAATGPLWKSIKGLTRRSQRVAAPLTAAAHS